MELEQFPPKFHDVWKKDIIRHYENRPDALESTCLANFASRYNVCTYRPQKQAVIRYRLYAIDDAWNYKCEHVMLFLPFRQGNALLDGNTFEEIYRSQLEVICAKKKECNGKIDTEWLGNVCSEIMHEAHHQPPIIKANEWETDVEDADLLIGGEAEREARLMVRWATVMKRQDIMLTQIFYEMTCLTNA